MSRILVAEDSPTQALHIRTLLEEAGFQVELCTNGREALEAIRRSQPDLVLTDLKMPEMDGLELVETVRREQPSLPVILVTEFGTEEIAVQALQKGAASYVPKRNLGRDIIPTIDEVLIVANAHRHQEWILECMTQTATEFSISNDQNLIPPLISYLQGNLRRMKICDETGLIRVSVAINEALTNAIFHGNLDVGSEVQEQDEDAYMAMINQRTEQPPFRDRRVHVSARESAREAVYVVRDEGAGFDPRMLPDPTDPANLMKSTGRGLLLIRAFMDTVYHNSIGNEITMIKWREP
jgi:CheY-like chemotaxis protein